MQEKKNSEYFCFRIMEDSILLFYMQAPTDLTNFFSRCVKSI